MRTFLAVDISEETRAGIAALLRNFRKTGSGIKWVDPGLLHITLFFFGEVDENLLQRLEAVTEDTVQKTARFTIKAGGLGGFPRLESPRVVWAGISNETGELKDIYRGIRERVAAEKLPVKTDARQYTPHITIGRVKSRPDQRLLESIDAQKDTQFGTFEAEEVVLYRSVLSRGGPDYTVLKKFRFRNS